MWFRGDTFSNNFNNMEFNHLKKKPLAWLDPFQLFMRQFSTGYQQAI